MHFAILLRLSDIPIPVPHAQHPTTRARASSDDILCIPIAIRARAATRGSVMYAARPSGLSARGRSATKRPKAWVHKGTPTYYVLQKVKK